MSKIQEALKMLQTSRGLEDEPRKRLRNEIDLESPSGKRPIAADGQNDSTVPDHHVDVAKLVEQGLLPSHAHLQMVAAEFRRVKRPLLKNAFGKASSDLVHPNVLMITSALPKTGKSFCAVNLALSIALERELNVLLVDADVAKPHISRAFDLSQKPGLIDILVDDSIDIASLLVPTDLHNITVLPAGRAHEQATELLASARMSALVDSLSSRYSDRLIIIDSPPLLVTSEAQALASQVGQIVLIIEYGRTSHRAVADVTDMLDSGKPVNVILNKSQSRASGGEYGSYGYGYGYGYGYEADDSEKEEATSA